MTLHLLTVDLRPVHRGVSDAVLAALVLALRGCTALRWLHTNLDWLPAEDHQEPPPELSLSLLKECLPSLHRFPSQAQWAGAAHAERHRRSGQRRGPISVLQHVRASSSLQAAHHTDWANQSVA